MPEIIVIADDLSGAADSGVAFTHQGYQAVVMWRDIQSTTADVMVLSTESRHISPTEAAIRVRDIGNSLSKLGMASLFYKKIDSTLRGHPAAELLALMDALAIKKALVAPAFPAQGRTTRHGLQYVNGIPLTHTSFGCEVSTASIYTSFAEFFGIEHIFRLPLEIVRHNPTALQNILCESCSDFSVAVADAETDADLARLVTAARSAGIRLFCGSAGLADALAKSLPQKQTKSGFCDIKKTNRRVMCVIASRRESTVQQVTFAREKGVPVVCPDISWLLAAAAVDSQMDQRLAQLLKTHGKLILTALSLPDLPGQSALICERLADAVYTLTKDKVPTGLVISGGDMVYALSMRLGATGIVLRGEVLPGIPWGVFLGGCAEGWPIVTKAGGFGTDETLAQLIHFLESDRNNHALF